MYIYAIKNLNNGRIYIGRTIQTLSARFSQHKRRLMQGRHHNIVLQRSFDKHGLSSFSFFELASATSFEQLRTLESEFISKYNSDGNCYNLTEGGDGIVGFKHSDDAKSRIGIASRLRGGGRVGGHKLSGVAKPADVVEKIRLANKGKKRSAEVTNGLRSRRLGKPNVALYKKIKSSDGRVFDSLIKAAIAIKAKPDSISEVLRGRRKTIYGLKFSYIENLGG